MCPHIHSSERENSDSEGAAKVVTNRKHSIYTHFPKDRNCGVCLGTKITRVPCRRRDEGSIPRAVKFGELMGELCKTNLSHDGARSDDVCFTRRDLSQCATHIGERNDTSTPREIMQG